MTARNKTVFPPRKRLILAACLMFIASPVILSGGCAKKKTPQEIPPRPVGVATAAKADVPITIGAFGTLISPEDVDIVAQVTGQIQEVHFREGDEVKKGDLLFTIDPRIFRATLEERRASLEAAEVDLRLKEQTLRRNQELIKKKLISQQDYDTYQSQVDAARAQVALNQASVEVAEIDLGYCSIVSPISGVTGKRLVDPGNIVTANSGNPLVNIKSLDPLYIDFALPEKDLSRVKNNMAGGELKATVSPVGDLEGPYQAVLQMIDNAVDPATGTISLRATVRNRDRKLWPGQFAIVSLEVETAVDAILVPASAVQLGQNGMFLYTVTDDNRAELKDSLRVGDQDGDRIIIEKGVNAGERVVTSGQLGLRAGLKVEVVSGGDGAGGEKSGERLSPGKTE